MKSLKVLALVTALACVPACSSDQPPIEIERFFDDFHASRYSTAAAHARALDAAAAADPRAGRLSFDRALAHDWHLAESPRDPNPDPALLAAEAMNQIALFQIARENNPDD